MRTLELKCKAPAWFDPETQKYELCPGRLEATIDQAGQKLDCPICGAPMDVPSAAHFHKLAPRPEPEKPPLDLEDEFQLAPETPPNAASSQKAAPSTAKTAQVKASSAKPALVKAVPAKAKPSQTAPAPPESKKQDVTDEPLSVGDLSGETDDGTPPTPIRHTDEEHWMALAPDVDPPPIDTRVKALMDDDDGEEYRVSGPAVPAPTSAAASGPSTYRDGDAFDGYAPGARSDANPAGEETVDLGAFEDDSETQTAPSADWLSAPLPGAEPVHPGFATAPLPSHPTVAGQLTDASRILAPAKTEWIPRHRVLAAQEIACPNCGSSLQREVELCERCGYHLRLKRIVRTFEPSERVGGFDLWIKKHLHEQASVAGMKAIVGVLGPIMVLAMMAIAFFVIGPAMLCLFVPFGMLVLTLGVVCLIPGPRGADPFNFWWAILQLQRLSGWKFLHQSTVPLGVLERRTRDFGDADLDNLPELETTDVLDLQGSSVTDEGVQLLRFYKNLKFLVVRDTDVSARGVKNLQHDFPELLIWR